MQGDTNTIQESSKCHHTTIEQQPSKSFYDNLVKSQV